MRHSRYLWIFAISITCLMGFLAWETPVTVVSALAHPEYADSPRAAVQHFWNLLDTRQFTIAREMLRSSPSAQEPPEFVTWVNALEKNPLLSLQKVEFLETSDPLRMRVRVSWVAPPHSVDNLTYVFGLIQEGGNWHILEFHRLES